MQHRVEMWRTLRRIVTAAAIIGGAWFLIVRPIERSLANTGERMERGLRDVLGAITNTDTRIVEGRAEIAETAEISELSLLEMRMSATRTIEKSEELSGIIPVSSRK
ncbi:MAG: hypothetical protein EOP88_27900, partial [Verrucomicrobiaceae bacterium]